MSDYYLIAIIIGMAVVTYIPRLLPMLLLSRKEISPSFNRWMTYIPVSIFAALVASDVFFWEDSFNVNVFENGKLIPTVFVLLVAYKTKSLLWSMVVGIGGITVMWLFM